jgi:hypothetical protein
MMISPIDLGRLHIETNERNLSPAGKKMMVSVDGEQINTYRLKTKLKT